MGANKEIYKKRRKRELLQKQQQKETGILRRSSVGRRAKVKRIDYSEKSIRSKDDILPGKWKNKKRKWVENGEGVDGGIGVNDENANDGENINNGDNINASSEVHTKTSGNNKSTTLKMQVTNLSLII